MYVSTKTYGHEIGLSCAFRQWRAESHCRFLHGYALSVKLVFDSPTLDDNGWVVDFGGLKEIKDFLIQTFDHTMVVAADDPSLSIFQNMERHGLVQLTVLKDGVGCERFAEYIADFVLNWLYEGSSYNADIQLRSVEVREHGANSAIWERSSMIGP